MQGYHFLPVPIVSEIAERFAGILHMTEEEILEQLRLRRDDCVRGGETVGAMQKLAAALRDTDHMNEYMQEVYNHLSGKFGEDALLAKLKKMQNAHLIQTLASASTTLRTMIPYSLR